MVKFSKDKVLKACTGCGFITTPKEYMKSRNKGEIANSKFNRNPNFTPWSAENLYSWMNSMLIQGRDAEATRGIKGSCFIGHIRPMQVIVESGEVRIKDGGHTDLAIANISDDYYRFPKCPAPNHYPELAGFSGHTVADVKKFYPGIYNTIMEAPFVIVKIRDDANLQVAQNSGKTMSSLEKVYAHIGKTPNYQAIESFFDVTSSCHSTYHNYDIGANRGGNIRVRVNNAAWLFSLATYHDMEKSGEAMEYVVNNYDAAIITEVFENLMDVVTEFDFIFAAGKKSKNVINCNIVHGLVEYARRQVVKKHSRGRKAGSVVCRELMGSNFCTDATQKDERVKFAYEVIKYLDTNKNKIIKLQKSVDMAKIPQHGAGHKNSGAHLATLLEKGGK